MRLIVLLVTLLIIGYAIYQQIGPARPPTAPAADTETAAQPPRVPQRVEELRDFESQMQQFMDASGAERRRQMEEMEP